jgi:hypothetical protein
MLNKNTKIFLPQLILSPLLLSFLPFILQIAHPHVMNKIFEHALTSIIVLKMPQLRVIGINFQCVTIKD